LGEELVAEDPIDIVGAVEVVGGTHRVDDGPDFGEVRWTHMRYLRVDTASEMIVEAPGL
jgi:hypothetical protein